MNVNTGNSNAQAKNTVNTTLLLTQIKQHLGDIESQALSIQTLSEMCFEQIDSITSSDPDVARITLRLDALVKASYRNAVLVQEAVDSAGALIVGEEVAQ